MGLNDFLPDDSNTKIAKEKTIYITKKTVKFGNNIYQFRNITGFGVGEVQPDRIPFKIIAVLFILGLIGFILFAWGVIQFLLLIPMLLAISAIVYNFTRPELYGLKLYMNSGDAQIFVTADISWLKIAIGKLYDFMENAEEGSSMTIQVGRDIQGNIIQGSHVRDILNQIEETSGEDSYY